MDWAIPLILVKSANLSLCFGDAAWIRKTKSCWLRFTFIFLSCQFHFHQPSPLPLYLQPLYLHQYPCSWLLLPHLLPLVRFPLQSLLPLWLSSLPIALYSLPL